MTDNRCFCWPSLTASNISRLFWLEQQTSTPAKNKIWQTQHLQRGGVHCPQRSRSANCIQITKHTLHSEHTQTHPECTPKDMANTWLWLECMGRECCTKQVSRFNCRRGQFAPPRLAAFARRYLLCKVLLFGFCSKVDKSRFASTSAITVGRSNMSRIQSNWPMVDRRHDMSLWRYLFLEQKSEI